MSHWYVVVLECFLSDIVHVKVILFLETFEEIERLVQGADIEIHFDICMCQR